MASLIANRLRPAQLRRVAAEAGIGPDDPLGPVMDALADAVEAVAVVPGDCANKFNELDARLSAILDRAEAQAGGHIARQAALQIPAAVDRVVRVRYWWLAVFVGVILAGGIYAGYWCGERKREEQIVQLSARFDMVLKRKNAESWLRLMQQNTGDKALEGCHPVPQADNNGDACLYPLWRRAPTVP